MKDVAAVGLGAPTVLRPAVKALAPCQLSSDWLPFPNPPRLSNHAEKPKGYLTLTRVWSSNLTNSRVCARTALFFDAQLEKKSRWTDTENFVRTGEGLPTDLNAWR